MRIGDWSIVEQLPRSCDFEGVTDNLKKGFWPNYNTPKLEKKAVKGSFIGSVDKNPNLTALVDYDSYLGKKYSLEINLKLKIMNHIKA